MHPSNDTVANQGEESQKHIVEVPLQFPSFQQNALPMVAEVATSAVGRQGFGFAQLPSNLRESAQSQWSSGGNELVLMPSYGNIQNDQYLSPRLNNAMNLGNMASEISSKFTMESGTFCWRQGWRWVQNRANFCGAWQVRPRTLLINIISSTFRNATAATRDQPAFVLIVPRRKPTDETQETLCISAFPNIHVKEKWANNLYIASVCYDRTVSWSTHGVKFSDGVESRINSKMQRSRTFLLPGHRRWAFHLPGETETLACDPSHPDANSNDSVPVHVHA